MLNKHGYDFDDAKLATSGLLIIKIFHNKGYDIKIRNYEVINKILSGDSNYIVDMFMWPKFDNLQHNKTTFSIIKLGECFPDLPETSSYL